MNRQTLVPTAADHCGRGPATVLLVAGTREQAVMVAPVSLALSSTGRTSPLLVAFGRSPAAIEEALAPFGVAPPISCPPRPERRSQAAWCNGLITDVDALLAEHRPALVVVAGDAMQALAGALAAFWRGIAVVHLAAGLRSYDLTAPFPGEANRRMVSQLASLHLTPTATATANLAAEGITGPKVLRVGSTSVDALLTLATVEGHGDERLLDVQAVARAGQRRLVLVDVRGRGMSRHGLAALLHAVADLVLAHPDVEVVLPVPANPRVRDLVGEILGRLVRVTVTEPLSHVDLARLLSLATLAVSDRPVVQEAAPSFRVPVLVPGEHTELTDAIDAGCARLVGTDRELIAKEADRLLSDEGAGAAMVAGGNPFGDGRAAARVEQAIAWLLGLSPDRPHDAAPASPASPAPRFSAAGSPVH